MKQTLLFIGHHFHCHTKSISFLLELIEKKFEAEYCYCHIDPFNDEDNTWQTSIQRKHYDVVLCLQVMPSIEKLKQHCSFDFGVFFPMADYYYRAQKDVSAPIWQEYQDFQIISFSRKMHEELIAHGFSSHYFQYFPEPAPMFKPGDTDSVFFWQRVTHINVYSILSLLKNYNIRHLHIHKAIDPGETYIPLPYEYQGMMKVSYSSWFERKDDMLKFMDESALYVAARYCEGIGMSFLEAMAHGRCVIAPDETTFNEYIKDGKNGFLFIPSNPLPLKTADIREIQKNAYEFIRDGYRKWCIKREKIVPLFTRKAEINLKKIQDLESIWCQHKKGTSMKDAVVSQNFANHFFARIKKYINIFQNKACNYTCKEEKKFCAIRWLLKMERNDKRKILIFFLGLPLFSVDIIEEN